MLKQAGRRTRQIQVALGVVLLGLSVSGFACKYKEGSLEDNVRMAQAVFMARAESSSNDRSGQGPMVPASMRVLQVVKGAVKADQTLPVYTDNSSCGLAIQRGQVWLILASGDPLRSDLPSGSVLLTDQAARYLVAKKLGVKLQ